MDDLLRLVVDQPRTRPFDLRVACEQGPDLHCVAQRADIGGSFR
jgi:hypothetical protein